MEHLWRGYLGTVGMYALGATDFLLRKIDGAPARPDMRADEVPILKSFYRDSGPARTTRYKSEMYDMLRELEEINRSIKARQGERREEDAKALYGDNSERLAALPELRKGA